MTAIDVETEAQVAYPSVFFSAKRRPCLEVWLPSVESDIDSLRKGVFAALTKEAAIPIQTVKSYLAYVGSIWKERLSGDWTSFGIEIGKNGDSVCPLDLVEVIPSDRPLLNAGPDIVTAKEDVWMVLSLLTVGRLSAAVTYPEYGEKIRSGATSLAIANGAPMSFKLGAHGFSSWPLDPGYLKLTAVFDMFYAKFPRSKEAAVRFGTVVSRYKDCVILTSLSHLKSMTGLNMGQLQHWIATAQMGDEFASIMKPGNEINKPDSYMPYLSDMGISPKSPYSATANSSLHMWAHIVALYLGSEKSKNARIPLESDLPNVQINAALLAFALRTRSGIVKQYRAIDEEEIEAEASPSELDTPNPYPVGRSAWEWIKWYVDNGSNLGDDIKRVCNELGKRVKGEREGTIGKWLTKHPIP